MNPSPEQIKSAMRTFVATLGGIGAGWAIGKGWITQEQATAVLSNQEFMSAASLIAVALLGSASSTFAGIWGMVAHKQANVIAAVAAMPEVAEVKTIATQEGMKLAQAINDAGPPPGAVVTVEGSGH